MKCSECQEAGQTSKVYSDGATRTLMGGGGPFWDEEGVRHSHEPNITTSGYHCSNGHRWTHRWLPACPAKGCAYNDDELVNSGS